MKIVAVVDEDRMLTPLDYGDTIVEIDEEKNEIKEYENPGYGMPHGGKEIAMRGILTLKPDAIIVKEGTLCPGSYHMSQGRMKYIPVEEDTLDEVLQKLDQVKGKAVDQLEFFMFRE